MMKKVLHAAALFALVFAATFIFAGVSASAQQIASTTTRERTAASARLLKRMVIGVGESAEGSRVRITSDAPLDGYESFTRGGKFYILVRGADASTLAGRALTARGFTNVEAEQQGDDALISFTTEPGFEPRARPTFNRLEILFATQEQKPAGSNSSSSGSNGDAAAPTPTPDPPTAA